MSYDSVCESGFWFISLTPGPVIMKLLLLGWLTVQRQVNYLVIEPAATVNSAGVMIICIGW